MSQEVVQEAIKSIATMLQVFGVTSLTGFAAFYSTLIVFTPELTIDTVIDKSKEFNSESRLKIKNIGKLPALNIYFDVENAEMEISGFRIENGNFASIGSTWIPRLSSSESSETSVTPGIHFDTAAPIGRFSYVLSLKYDAKILFMKKRFTKKWRVELRSFGDGFSWLVAPTE